MGAWRNQTQRPFQGGTKNSNLSITKREKNVRPGVHVDKFLTRCGQREAGCRLTQPLLTSGLLETWGEAGGGGSFREVTWPERAGLTTATGGGEEWGNEGGGGGYVPFPAQIPLNRVTLLNCLGVGSGEFTDYLTLCVLERNINKPLCYLFPSFKRCYVFF